MKYLFSLIILLTFTCSLRAQEYDYTDSIGRNKLKLIIQQVFRDTLNKHNYVLFSVADTRYLFIIDKKDSYDEYYLNETAPSKKMQFVRIEKPNHILARLFIDSLYHKDYINLKSNFFSGKSVFFTGLDTYFYYMTKGRKIGEANLAMVIKPNPIDSAIYHYLFITDVKMFNSSIK